MAAMTEKERDKIMDEIIKDKVEPKKTFEEEDYLDEDTAAVALAALESLVDMIDLAADSLTKGVTKNYLCGISKGLYLLHTEASDELDKILDAELGLGEEPK